MKTYLLSILLLVSPTVYSQSSFRIGGGAGFPELLHLELNIDLPEVTLSGGVGSVSEDNVRTYFGSIQKPFGRESKFVDRRRMYWEFGGLYSTSESYKYYFEDYLAFAKVGVNMYATKNFGGFIDLGVMVIVNETKTLKPGMSHSSNNWITFDLDFTGVPFPCLSTGLFFRLGN